MLMLCLRSNLVPSHVQAALYGWSVVYITGFIGTNYYSFMLLMLAVPAAAYHAYIVSSPGSGALVASYKSRHVQSWHSVLR